MAMICEEHRVDAYKSMKTAGFALPFLGAWMVLASVGLPAQNVRSLGSVRTISIGSLGEDPGGKGFAREFGAQLRRNKSLQPAAGAQADAVLKGQGVIWIRGYHSFSPRARVNDTYAEPIYGGYLSVTLHGAGGEVLWSYFAHSKHADSRSAVEKDVAGQVLDAMSDAIRTASAATPSSIGPGGTRAAALRGGGATFPFPIYEWWFTSFQREEPAITITYDPLGSSAGVERFSEGEFDFAGSDVPLSVLKPARQGQAFPTVAGGVVLAYNLPKFPGDLRLTPEAAAGVLAGRIARWNDPALRALNPGTSLPDQPIRVIHRSDGSGTTFALTHYLSEAVREWKEKVGEGDRVQWPVGEGAAGNDGVSALIENTPYSFGYTEFIYAFRRQLNIAAIRNAAGRFVQADLASIAAAVAGVMDSIPPDFNLSLANTPGRDAYPISALTWLVIPAHEVDPDKREALKRFLEWALGPGQRQTMALGYVPLPKLLIEEELKALAALN